MRALVLLGSLAATALTAAGAVLLVSSGIGADDFSAWAWCMTGLLVTAGGIAAVAWLTDLNERGGDDYYAVMLAVTTVAFVAAGAVILL